jgi:hypothetical protein
MGLSTGVMMEYFKQLMKLAGGTKQRPPDPLGVSDCRLIVGRLCETAI